MAVSGSERFIELNIPERRASYAARMGLL